MSLIELNDSSSRIFQSLVIFKQTNELAFGRGGKLLNLNFSSKK